MKAASETAFLLAFCLAVVAALRGGYLQISAAKRTRPGRHWWFRMNMLDPLLYPDAWPPEAVFLWKRSLLWVALFVACVAGGLLVAHLGGWLVHQKP